MDVLKIIVMIIGALGAATFLIIDIIQWRMTDCKDSDTCIIVINKKRFYFRVFTSIVVIVIFIISLVFYVLEGTRDTWYQAPVFSILVILSNIHWKYFITEKGIKNPYGYLLTWEHVKGWKWVSETSNSLFIEHDKGYFTLKISENKELVSEFLNKKKI